MPADSNNILWLASYPKSGNTWVRAFLTAYLLDVRVPFDLKAMDRFTASESLYRDYINISGRRREDLDIDTIDSLRKAVQESVARRRERPFWAKTHNANVKHRGCRLIHPDLTKAAVYIVRNPLDVVDSLADSCGRSIDQAIALLNDPRHTLGGPQSVHVRQYLGTWSEHVLSWSMESAFPVLLLRYEDMQTNGLAVFAELVRFLNWPLDNARLQRALERTCFTHLKEAERSNGFAERNPASRSGTFFRRGLHNAWRSILSSEQVARIWDSHREVMEALGYGTSLAASP